MIPSCVLFDCDGVLVDSEPTAFALLGEEFSAHGLTLAREEVEHLFIGGTIRGDADKARALGADLPEDWADAFYTRLYARLAEGTDLMPGIPALLDVLDAAGISYAVGSNGTSQKMRITLGQHSDIWDRLRGRLFSGQELGRPKPDPGVYLHAAAALGADPTRAVVVEDSPTGVRAARAAGMRCLGYAPRHRQAALAAEGAEPFWHMDQVPALIGL